ncbi:hypothetical protein FEM48_Zijuj02G0209400 [Ziziphus jujuba var. spinosa]|uniref:CRESS-DNA virus Rep endonuclease domain-containing protein n=1 Tax=Ziziphus jujuba var. spinosa TaxID=714518 RepID=A0A978VXX0_ZIZJJ|nr:hypothetical protein FEM48_Zijuj02G0209400 [Ziziphus jujuba var. spinosa]
MLPRVPLTLFNNSTVLMNIHSSTSHRDFRNINMEIAGLESHDDGNLHLHVLILTERKMDFRSPRHFDVDGYHPNIQPARSVQDVYQYVTKGGNYKEYGEPPKPNQNPIPKKNRTFRTIIRECSTKQEYLDKIKEVFPYEWATKLRYFEYSGEAQFPEPKPEYKPIYTPSDFQVPPELQDWVNANIFTVSAESYSLINPGANVYDDLKWMQDLTEQTYLNKLNFLSMFGRIPTNEDLGCPESPYISVDPHEPARTCWGQISWTAQLLGRQHRLHKLR